MQPRNVAIVFAALLLCALRTVPVPAHHAATSEPEIELNITASGSTIAEHPLQITLRAGQVATMNFAPAGQAHQYRYTLHAHQPARNTLPIAARKITTPIAVSIRIDSSLDGQEWQLQTHTNLIIPAGNIVSAEVSDVEKSTHLIVMARLLNESLHKFDNGLN